MSRLALTFVLALALAAPAFPRAASVEATEVLFDKPGVVTLGCNIHDLVLEASATPSVAFVLDVLPRKAKYKPPLDRLKY